MGFGFGRLQTLIPTFQTKATRHMPGLKHKNVLFLGLSVISLLYKYGGLQPASNIHTILWLTLSRNLFCDFGVINIDHPISSGGCIPRPPASEIHHHMYLDPLLENPGSAPGCNEYFRCVFITQYIY